MAKTEQKKKVKRQVIDFTNDKEDPKFKNGSGKVMSKKQIRARARRHARISEAELNKLYKPIEEWDEEELARGRPRAADGSFRGASPGWITRHMHEEAMARFKGLVEGRVRQHTVDALQTVQWILSNEDIDERGRPVIPASTKLDAAKFLIEHVIGKPTQRQEVDISVRLQALLATATVSPFNDGAENFALPPGADYEAAFGTSAYDEDEDDDVEEAEVIDD